MSMMSIQAAVCYERGEPLVVESLNLEDPGKNEVRVRLKAAASGPATSIITTRATLQMKIDRFVIQGPPFP